MSLNTEPKALQRVKDRNESCSVRETEKGTACECERKIQKG